MPPGFLEFIARAARLMQSGHADDAEALVWTTLEESSFPAEEGADPGVAAEVPAGDQREPGRSTAVDDSR